MRDRLKQYLLNLLWKGALRQYQADSPTVIGIAGSVGKTSTKEAVATLLETAGHTVTKSYGNLATDFGIALSLLGYRDTPATKLGWLRVAARAAWGRPRRAMVAEKKSHYYVLEYSSDSAGDTTFLTDRIPPQLAILCTIVPVHMEQYGDEATMVQETLSLIDPVGADGLVIANVDDPVQERELTKKRLAERPIRWYGVRAKNAPKKGGVWLTQPERHDQGLRVQVQFIGNGVDSLTNHIKSVRAKTAVIAHYQLYPLAAAAAVGEYLKLPVSAIQAGLAAYQLPAGRGRLIEGRQDITIIDDTANASPEPVKMGLQTLKEFAGSRRRVAVLGNMNELGAHTEAAHQEVGAVAAKTADYFIALGPNASAMLTGAKEAGMSESQMIAFPTPERLMSQMNQFFKRGDVVYLKASQNGMRLERIVKLLMLNPKDAPRLLVRQGKYWQK